MNVEESKDEAPSAFTGEELEMLSELDSTSFGFLKLNKFEESKKKSLVFKMIKCLEKYLQKEFQNKENDSSVLNKNNSENTPEKSSAICTEDDKEFQNKENDSSVVNKNNSENTPEKSSAICTEDVPHDESNSSDKTITILPTTEELTKEEIYVRIFRKLGHFHLLLEDYVKGIVELIYLQF
ncbi:hypothetical protein CEXT_133782 [Caerostris extrusa]|uniref:Uncharacterized protein n=1 Tax=Caerostris extrusa TaxID=172846 RepID=A0AAV4WKD6_CAEEX|nr:uncharacterized protein CEXT_133783 [Caerostris extrusa]GIY83128.1 hypothetical protein CEXT_133782 [Caerostris extrusa]